MGWSKLLLAAAAAFLFAVGSCAVITGPSLWRDDIPALCVSESVTPVSCGAAGPDALLPHPDDCRLFYYCEPGHAPVCRQCPAQLHFNPALHVCDAPEHAGCQPSTNSPEF